MTVPAPDLAERYGAPPGARRPLVIALIAVLAVVGGAWLLWVMVFHGRPDVTSQLTGYDVRDQHQAVATFEVTRRDGDVRASCLLRAYAADHSVVGELTVPVTSGPSTTRLESTVRTEREATSVELVGCTTPEQTRAR